MFLWFRLKEEEVVAGRIDRLQCWFKLAPDREESVGAAEEREQSAEDRHDDAEIHEQGGERRPVHTAVSHTSKETYTEFKHQCYGDVKCRGSALASFLVTSW